MYVVELVGPIIVSFSVDMIAMGLSEFLEYYFKMFFYFGLDESFF